MRPEEQTAKPDAEDQDIESLVGDRVEDPFAHTWPDLGIDDPGPDVPGEIVDEYLHEPPAPMGRGRDL